MCSTVADGEGGNWLSYHRSESSPTVLISVILMGGGGAEGKLCCSQTVNGGETTGEVEILYGCAPHV